jgi:hypothetical protein
VLAEFAQAIDVYERGCGRGDEHLPAVAGGCDPRRPVHVGADVPLLGGVWRPGVYAHAHADRPNAKGVARLRRRRDRAGAVREGDEEGVTLRVDLHAAVARECIAKQAPVLGERVRVILGAELVQEAGRALDVRKEKGDGP